MRRLLPLLAIPLLAALATGLGACRAPSVNDIPKLEAEVARSEEAAVRAQVLAALEPLDPLRYHEHDATIRNDGHIPAGAVIWARRAREVLDWVDWPPELDGHVEQYAEWLDALLDAFLEDDAQAAAEPSKIAHALAHNFEATLERWLSNESLPAVPELAGLEPPTHDDSHGGSGGQMENGEHDDHTE